MRLFLLLAFLFLSFYQSQSQQSIPRQWNEQLLEAIRNDFARPTVHARNLFHTSVAMYDAWAAYDSIAKPFLLGNTVGGYTCIFNGVPQPADVAAARDEAISYAAYRLMRYRFQNSPVPSITLNNLDQLFQQLGYDKNFTNTNYSSGSPAALGNYIASQLILFGFQDGSNEQGDYGSQYYSPVNPPLEIKFPGNPNIRDPNRWQPLTLDVAIDQSGNPVPGTAPFLGPEWGNVTPFSLTSDDLTVHQRNGNNYLVYHDPGPPPLLDTTMVGGISDQYKWSFALVSAWSSHLDPADTTMWDISPASIGNIQSYPQSIQEYPDFYNFEDGGDPSPGHALNPVTGLPYEPQMVRRADYTRVLAEFWADGPDSETPPGHWFTIINYVHDHPDFVRRYRGKGPIIDDTEWDVKAYLILGGAMHDVAVTAWGIKGWYDYIRPVSAIRCMAGYGQSSDVNLPNYHPGGLPLIPDFIELVDSSDALAGANFENVNKVKIYAWKGPDYIGDPDIDIAGVDWILAESWWPYQRPTFVTPPFAGYISGHSTYSRAAAEILTMLTGDPFFPGGMGEFVAPKNEFLVFEEGPSMDVVLQWATYRDASDQTSLSRIWGGIHPPADDIPGRLIGATIGVEAFNFAESYFFTDNDEDGYYNYEDCDDENPNVNPGHAEVCDGLDNDCNGMVDDSLTIYTYYLDMDNDGYGDAANSIDTCTSMMLSGYVANALDCNDGDSTMNPAAIEVCDGLDNDCDGMVDDSLTIYTYYLDMDNDGYGDEFNSIDTCTSMVLPGYVTVSGDCNDADSTLNPGIIEICDGLDNDCNGMVDDSLTIYTYYLDMDNDGYGDVANSIDTCSSILLPGYVANALDCNDADSTLNPAATEIPDNGIDEDCDGEDLVGTTDITEKKLVRIYPNPVHDELTIEYQAGRKVIIQLIGIDGRLFKTEEFAFQKSAILLRMEELPEGMYFLKLQDLDSDEVYIRKVVHQ